MEGFGQGFCQDIRWEKGQQLAKQGEAGDPHVGPLQEGKIKKSATATPNYSREGFAGGTHCASNEIRRPQSIWKRDRFTPPGERQSTPYPPLWGSKKELVRTLPRDVVAGLFQTRRGMAGPGLKLSPPLRISRAGWQWGGSHCVETVIEWLRASQQPGSSEAHMPPKGRRS